MDAFKSFNTVLLHRSDSMEPHKNLIDFFEAAHDDTAKSYFTIFVAATILITAKDILCLLGVLIKIVLTEMCHWFHNQECSPEYVLSILQSCIA